MNTNSKLIIGIDYGGVCSDSDVTDSKRDITVPGCLEALNSLSKEHDLYLISFCGPKRAKDIRNLLRWKYPELFKELFFVKKKTYKNAVCKYIGADVMIDDKTEVLKTITDAHTILFTDWKTTLERIRALSPKGNIPDENALNEVVTY